MVVFFKGKNMSSITT